MNLPNRITTARLILAIVLFAFLSQVRAQSPNKSMMLDISWVLFIIAAASDFLDGHLARKYNMVTAFGRIADPFVDKILVCGAFIFLIVLTPLVRPWMVVVIIGREFLITGLRGYAESQGISFPANKWGKMKTVFQSFTIVSILLYLAHLQKFPWATKTVTVFVWGAVGITLLSGWFYLQKSHKIWSEMGA